MPSLYSILFPNAELLLLHLATEYGGWENRRVIEFFEIRDSLFFADVHMRRADPFLK